ncbi:PilX N-terminal domain-containing pilus assembly protein [Rugamonas sp.]|uniref:pilus assembly PilX family protein n=1 Tax=Rugamonas sp. TaxID=1926287 RepID=UPI0025D939D6|nr:PilX N-terminal domain-containing pilus assembly protein [Rugamonas sp.]
MTTLFALYRAERGVVLITALLMLIAVLLVGASAARMALQGERAARAERDRQIAFQAAEDGLRDAERDIGGVAPAPGRAAMFAAGSALGFADGCGVGDDGANLGLCRHAAPAAVPVWQALDLAHDGAHSVEYGQYSGAAMETGQGFLPFKRPRYIIERMACHQAGEEASAAPTYCYRVTAIGFGARPATQVVLQSVYRKAE